MPVYHPLQNRERFALTIHEQSVNLEGCPCLSIVSQLTVPDLPCTNRLLGRLTILSCSADNWTKVSTACPASVLSSVVSSGSSPSAAALPNPGHCPTAPSTSAPMATILPWSSWADAQPDCCGSSCVIFLSSPSSCTTCLSRMVCHQQLLGFELVHTLVPVIRRNSSSCI